MTQIDKQSSLFMDWFRKEWQKPAYRKMCRKRAVAMVQDYLDSHDDEALLEALMPKLQKGAEEHGAPLYREEEIDTEIDNEIIDLLGWPAIGDWNRNRAEKT